MSIKDVLIHVDAHEHKAAYLDAALDLVAQHDAHFTGLHAYTVPHFPRVGMGYVPDKVIEVQRDQYVGFARDAQEQFQAACARHDAEPAWLNIEANTTLTILEHGRRNDLIVMAIDGVDRIPRQRNELVEEVLLGAGRPVLVIPRDWSGEAIGSHVTVGWDSGREAARAVADSLPLLQRAEGVSIAAIGGPEADLSAEQVSRHLARHGVDVTAESPGKTGDTVGEALLAWTQKQGSNLLVMGGYGHSRAREMFMGGATRHVLAHAPHPVLLSH